MKILSKIVYGIFVLALIAMAGLFLATKLPIPFANHLEIKIVKSGSMTPAIPTGSLILVAPSKTYAIGEVITFGEDTKQQIPTTHRIVSMRTEGGQTWFQVKGDANEEPDTQEVKQSDVIGKVMFHAPYLGYVLDFARQPKGFALLIGIPAVIIILDELLNIFGEVGKLRRRRKDPPQDYDDRSGGGDDGMRRVVRVPVKHIGESLMVLMFVFGLAHYTGFGPTAAYFTDSEHSLANIFRAGVWGEQLPPPQVFPVVINEFLPNPDDEANGLDFGNDASNMPKGEWVELFNNGSTSINVAGWELRDASGGGGNTHAIISALNTQPATTTIPAHGFLVVYYNKPTLNNTGDSIFLVTGTSTGHVTVDQTTYNDPSHFCENEPSPGGTNASSTPSGTPANGNQGDCNQAQVAPNKSYARIPDGTGAFVDPIPTPGHANILAEGEEPPANDLGPAPVVTVDSSAPVVVEEASSTPPVIDTPTEEASSTPQVEPEAAPEATSTAETTEQAPEPIVEPESTTTVELEPTPEPENSQETPTETPPVSQDSPDVM